jgi:hypothetical protein
MAVVSNWAPISHQCANASVAASPTNSEVAAWSEQRNKHHAKADWQFTTADTRVKLKRLYPAL